MLIDILLILVFGYLLICLLLLIDWLWGGDLWGRLLVLLRRYLVRFWFDFWVVGLWG
jgi:hypothetical protein